jgi:F-type H+-transporting ATPase subunit delta
MISQQIAKKYSNALFQLAKEKGLLDQAWEQFKSLAEYLRRDRSFKDFMLAPQVSDRKKEDLVRKAFHGKMEEPFFNFLMFLVEKRRIGFLLEIIEEFDRLVREDKGILKVTCITSAKITDDERRELIDRLAAKTSKEIEIEEKVDRSIIGGMVVMLHNQIIDGSIRHGLNLLRNRLLKVKVH